MTRSVELTRGYNAALLTLTLTGHLTQHRQQQNIEPMPRDLCDDIPDILQNLQTDCILSIWIHLWQVVRASGRRGSSSKSSDVDLDMEKVATIVELPQHQGLQYLYETRSRSLTMAQKHQVMLHLILLQQESMNPNALKRLAMLWRTAFESSFENTLQRVLDLNFQCFDARMKHLRYQKAWNHMLSVVLPQLALLVSAGALCQSKPSMHWTGFLVSRLCRTQQWTAALQLMKMQQKAGYSCNVFMVTALIRACHSWSLSFEILLETSRSNTTPDVVMYSIVVDALVKGFQWREAFGLASLMAQEGLVADAVIFSILANAHSTSAHWIAALSTISSMQLRLGRPNRKVYFPVMKVCSSKGSWETAPALLMLMQSQRAELDGVGCAVVSRACARGTCWWGTLHVLHKVYQNSITPHSGLLEAGVEACATGNQWRFSVAFCSEAWHRYMEQSQFMYEFLIHAVAPFLLWQRALWFVMHASSESLEPHDCMYSATIGAFAQSQQWKYALALLAGVFIHSFQARECRVYTWNRAAAACQARRQWQWTEQLFLRARGISQSLDAIMTCTVVSASQHNHSLWGRSLMLLDCAQRFTVRFDAPLLNAAINACSLGVCWLFALQLLTAMPMERPITIRACEQTQRWAFSINTLTSLSFGPLTHPPSRA